jgi:hypothetical protein
VNISGIQVGKSYTVFADDCKNIGRIEYESRDSDCKLMGDAVVMLGIIISSIIIIVLVVCRRWRLKEEEKERGQGKMKEMEDKEEALRELQSNAASTNKSGF